jgi:hypothetical protein
LIKRNAKLGVVSRESTGGQAKEQSTGGEDGQCDLEDELDY